MYSRTCPSICHKYLFGFVPAKDIDMLACKMETGVSSESFCHQNDANSFRILNELTAFAATIMN
jgi:hypothetical protein